MNLLIPIFFAATIFFNMSDNKDFADQDIDKSVKPLYTFGIIADAQYADVDPAGTRYYRSSLSKLRESVKSFRNDSVDFLLNLGDLIDKDFASFKKVLDIIDSSGIKTYHVTGNHDYSVDSGLKKQIPVSNQSDGGYYSLIHKNFRFIFLNGNDISTYISTDRSEIKYAEDYIAALKNSGLPNAIEWNGGIGSPKLSWLASQLDDATLKDEKVFIICHFPLFPVNVHNLLNYKEVLELLGKYKNVIAWFNGHNHAGNYGMYNNIHFVTFKGMVETERSNSYALVEVFKNKIRIRGSGREKDQVLGY
jgi:manganese-dependent ADP-ribose/CDP-alcohol diphosphatase